MTPSPARSRSASKRKYRRFRVSQPALVTCAAVPGLVWTARIVDISRRGMQLILEHPARLESEILIQWSNREISGRVRYQQQRGAEYRVGVALADCCDTLLMELLARETVVLRKIDHEVVSSSTLLRHKIREMAAALDAASRASEIKSRFLASVSHEFRTPLNGIIGFSELLHDGKAGPVTGEQKEYLSDILGCSRHLLTLINQVLDLTKIESGKMDFQYETLDPAVLVEEVKEGVAALAGRKGIELRAECDARVGSVRADAARLRQVLFNYLSNALKFTPEGGSVVVRLLPEALAYYRIVVEDSGVGIRADDLCRLFVEFGQLGRARTACSGTGLGLAITRQIVEKQGGRVGVESTVGKGSRFWAVLPVDPSHGTAGYGYQSAISASC
ncbi:MAG TPA: ATP-binding protein [Bryobacteraceae bacterium]|nr:ATP-binding protein [Bryobacteraceae bacterium]